MTNKNRWLIALSAIGIHMSIGSVYAWSVFKKPIASFTSWTDTDIAFTFSLAIIFLGLSAAFMGTWVERNGPRKSGILAAILFCGGLFVSSLSMFWQNIYLLYLGYGIIGGMGLGIGYITPVSTLVKWFPDKRGLATGLAIMGFGFAALLASPVIVWLIGKVGLGYTFMTMGVFYLPIMLLSASYIAPPPQDWVPAVTNKAGVKPKMAVDYYQPLTAKEALKTRRFYYLWLMLCINITCGIAIISVASPLAQEITKMSVAAAATMVGIMGAFNGLGRIGWASISDYIGRPNTYITFFVLQIGAFSLLPTAKDPLVFQALILLILTCYGGGFASIPAYIGDYFGTKQLSAIHGNILTAWALAGYVGPMLVSYIKQTTSSYENTLYIFVGFFVVALFVAILAKYDMTRAKRLYLEQRNA